MSEPIESITSAFGVRPFDKNNVFNHKWYHSDMKPLGAVEVSKNSDGTIIEVSLIPNRYGRRIIREMFGLRRDYKIVKFGRHHKLVLIKKGKA